MSDLHTALATVQADLPPIGKAHTADTGKYSYTYASLNDVNRTLLPVLTANGLTWACLPDSEGRRVVGLLTHAESGEQLESSWPLPSTTDPQALGSAVTYARRYLLLAVVGSAPDEDDDGAAAQGTDDREAQRRRDEAAAQVEALGDEFAGWFGPDRLASLQDYVAQSSAHFTKGIERLADAHTEWESQGEGGDA